MPGADLPPEIGNLKYARSWRPYQERVLAAARLHLADRRLHVVAAPGSGKTTLGLEVFRLLGRPAVVLSPTRTIREQWIERLHDFLPPETPWPIPWVSRSLDAPGLFTSVTYQALHSKSRADSAEADADEDGLENGDGPDPIGKAEIETVAAALRAARVGTLILDEAHHLRQEWWKALSELVGCLDDLRVVALTATPPYDARALGWQRYEELCGTIDEEISAPELVKAGTLCPHQDFVWTVVPTERESEFVAEHARQVEETFAELLLDPQFERAVTGHRWLGAEADLDEVLDDPE